MVTILLHISLDLRLRKRKQTILVYVTLGHLIFETCTSDLKEQYVNDFNAKDQQSYSSDGHFILIKDIHDRIDYYMSE